MYGSVNAFIEAVVLEARALDKQSDELWQDSRGVDVPEMALNDAASYFLWNEIFWMEIEE